MTNTFKNRPAFTLIEIIVATAIIAVLVLLFERLLLVNLKAYYQNSSKLELTDQSINAYKYLNPDLRGASQILICSPNNLVFYLKIGDTSVIPKKITFEVDQTAKSLILSVIEPTGTPPNIDYPPENVVNKTIAQKVVNSDDKPLFKYLDGSAQPLPSPCDPNKVKMVEIDLRNQDTGNYSSGEIQSITRIQIRNLKDNN